MASGKVYRQTGYEWSECGPYVTTRYHARREAAIMAGVHPHSVRVYRQSTGARLYRAASVRRRTEGTVVWSPREVTDPSDLIDRPERLHITPRVLPAPVAPSVAPPPPGAGTHATTPVVGLSMWGADLSRRTVTDRTTGSPWPQRRPHRSVRICAVGPEAVVQVARSQDGPPRWYYRYDRSGRGYHIEHVFWGRGSLPETIAGLVVLWGRVRRADEAVWLAEAAHPLAAYPLCFFGGGAVAGIAAAYGVPVVDAPETPEAVRAIAAWAREQMVPVGTEVG